MECIPAHAEMLGTFCSDAQSYEQAADSYNALPKGLRLWEEV